MVLRVIVALVAPLLLLEVGPAAWQHHFYPSNEFESPCSAHVSPVVQTSFDPAFMHGLWSEINIYDTQSAYYNDDEFDSPVLDFPVLISPDRLVDRTVVENPIALATPFMAGPPRSRHDLLLDHLLAAQAGPPTSTSPALSNPESDVLDVPVPVVTAALPGSRLPLPSSSTTLSAVFLVLSFLAISFVAYTAYLLKFAQTSKASSPSLSPVSLPTPAIPNSVPAAGKPWWARRLARSNKFVPALTPIPEALLEFDNDVILKALEALARQQKHAMRQKTASLAAAAVSPAPQTSSPDVVEPSVPVVAPITARAVPTISSPAIQTEGEVIYAASALRTPQLPISVPIIHQPAPTVDAAATNLHEMSAVAPRTPEIIYETPVPASSSTRTRALREPLIFYQTPAPASSSSYLCSMSDPTRDTFASNQNFAPAALPALIYSSSGSIGLPFRPYQNPRAPSVVYDAHGTITLQRAPLSELDIYPQELRVWGPQSHHYHEFTSLGLFCIEAGVERGEQASRKLEMNPIHLGQASSGAETTRRRGGGKKGCHTGHQPRRGLFQNASCRHVIANRTPLSTFGVSEAHQYEVGAPMSIPRQILIKPRQPMTCVRPIHLSHQVPPPELKTQCELLEFDCSLTLDRYLDEFHRDILPLPSLDESLDICALYAEMKSGALAESVDKLVDFRLRTMEEMLGWWRRLDKDVAKTVIPEDFPNFSHENLARTIMLANMFSMDNGLLELKSWTCMFLQVDNWLIGRWVHYQRRIYRRHAEPHLLIRSLALRVRDAIDNDKPSPHSCDIPLEDVSDTSLPPSLRRRAKRSTV
ncbi:hypothetical protein B0H16DRAFT_1480459 [Mycena metata]|uniref:Uncharacterized protein n=1 Tax=Mycena metata TaxID=1033252 RepID=A0AAD7H3U3_9AGAR|nr:hypothetical protein B0H16DRAFT_1480459 [Mycena metata]